MLVLSSLSIGCFLVISGFISLCAQPSADQKLDPNVFDRFLGTYRFSSGDVIVIGRSQRRLYFYEPATGLARGLDRSAASKSDLSWVAGPAFQVFSPLEFRMNFGRKQNEIETLTISASGGPIRLAKKLHLYHEEKVTFLSGNATLAGTLLIPITKGPHPAVVFIHGSGHQDRNGFVSLIRFVADHFARHGIATFTYDKRGVGGSTGNWATQTLDDLAADALAGFRMLQSRRDIDRNQIGLWGSSQAAWIMPKITTQTKGIAFIISVSGAGAGISVGDQVLYNLEQHISEQGG